MAEILLSLTIIGVVAAITLPSLTGNINERTWNTQRKALYARMSQAISLMPALNGYGKLTEGTDAEGNEVITEDTATETFITEGLAKVLKINNICDSEHLTDCGIPTKMTTATGSVLNDFTSNYNTLIQYNSAFDIEYTSANKTYSYKHLNTKAVAFETQNGESIITYYQPNCQNNMDETQEYHTQSKMCANFVYDLNGSKGPNTVGKDIGFISVLYPSDSVVVAPMPMIRVAGVHKAQIEGGQYCRAQNGEGRLPNREELAALFYNRLLLDIPAAGYWSNSILQNDTSMGWNLRVQTGLVLPFSRTQGSYIYCIER